MVVHAKSMCSCFGMHFLYAHLNAHAAGGMDIGNTANNTSQAVKEDAAQKDLGKVYENLPFLLFPILPAAYFD